MKAKKANSNLGADARSPSDGKSRLTTLELVPGAYPFKLREEETRLTGDQWAWRFLRLNPFYRYDYELWRQLPPVLRTWALHREKLTMKSIGPTKLDELMGLDSRHFCARGDILTELSAWPNYKGIPLGKLLEKSADLLIGDVTFRDFDSSRDYGISDWFDPVQDDLPSLEEGQSWFFSLTETVWEVASSLVQGPKEVWAHCPDGTKAVVGHEGSVSRVDSKNLKIYRRKSVVIREGQHIYEGESKDLVEDPDWLIPDTPKFPPTEIAFLIDMDMYLSSQLERAEHIVRSFQSLLLDETRIPKEIVPALPEFGPLVLPLRIAARCGFVRLPRAYDDLQHRSSKAKRNWRVVIVDAAFGLQEQFLSIENQLGLMQRELGQEGLLPFPLRQRAGRKDGNYWLKRALCLLELHVDLRNQISDSNEAKLVGDDPASKEHIGHKVDVFPMRIARILEDPDDELHAAAWFPVSPKSRLVSRQDIEDAVSDARNKYRDPLDVAKDLAEHGYRLLVGSTPAELYAGLKSVPRVPGKPQKNRAA